MSTKKELTVYIGRFSPFHLGHAKVLDAARRDSENVLVIVGSSYAARNVKNPFTFGERADMILDYVRETTMSRTCSSGNPMPKNFFPNVEVVGVQDQPYSESDWIISVMDEVNSFKEQMGIPDDVKPYLTGCNRDESSYYLNQFGDFFELALQPKHEAGELNATLIRGLLFEGAPIPEAPYLPATTVNFLKNNFLGTPQYDSLKKEYAFIKEYRAKWSAAPYDPIFMTVDTVVIQSGHVLVNVRDNFPGVGLWALPGGFLEKNERIIDAAIRELKEETRIELSDAQLYGAIKAKEIFDDPGRSLRGRTITTAFLLRLNDSKNLPKVKPQKGEVKKVMWVPLSDALACPENWFEDHFSILKQMYNRH